MSTYYIITDLSASKVAHIYFPTNFKLGNESDQFDYVRKERAKIEFVENEKIFSALNDRLFSIEGYDFYKPKIYLFVI